jgi:hypothetical protein
MSKVISFSMQVTEEDRARKERTGMTWPELLGLGIDTAEKQLGLNSDADSKAA